MYVDCLRKVWNYIKFQKRKNVKVTSESCVLLNPGNSLVCHHRVLVRSRWERLTENVERSKKLEGPQLLRNARNDTTVFLNSPSHFFWHQLYVSWFLSGPSLLVFLSIIILIKNSQIYCNRTRERQLSCAITVFFDSKQKKYPTS